MRSLQKFFDPGLFRLGVCLALAAPLPASAGLYFYGVSPTNVFWPGGIIPYEFDTNYHAITLVEQAVYLDVLREWELAANIHLVPRASQTNYLRLQFDPAFGSGYFCLCNPSTITIGGLGRGYAHEMGHALGLDHEHIRPDRDSYIAINYANLQPSASNLYLIVTNELTDGQYDLESIMHYSRRNFAIDPAVDVIYPQPAFSEKYYYRISSPCLSVGDRAAAAHLYGPPATPLTNLVTNTLDAGFGTLRAAIYYANDHPGTIIRFQIPSTDPGQSNGVWTIKPSGDLPPLVGDGTIIDGSTQPGFAGHPIIFVDGSGLIPEATGASTGGGETFSGNSSGLFVYQASCTIKSLGFIYFQDSGLALQTPSATNNSIQGCYIGVDATGSNAAPNATDGIGIFRGAKNNFIGGTNATQRNLISGNGAFGIWIGDTHTSGNVLLGNYVGTDATGSRAVSNSSIGIYLFNGPADVTIGGTNLGAGNVISGNAYDGVAMDGTSNSVVAGNFIGTDATGSYAVTNGATGIQIYGAAAGITIGGPSSAARNVISGNLGDGIILDGVSNSVVQGNYIGTDATGSNSLANRLAGIEIFNAAHDFTIGGTNAAARNIISGNGIDGIILNGARQGLVQGNYIGVDASGASAVPNAASGIESFNGTTGMTIGGASAGAANVISGNGYTGIHLGNDSSNVIAGNFIGTDASGTTAVPNHGDGIGLSQSVSNTIGGSVAGSGNLIAGNSGSGISIGRAPATGNLIQGNFIGIRSNGLNPLPNQYIGVYFFGGAANNVVGLGTTGSGAANLIAFNGYDGIHLDDTNTVGNTLRGNAIFSNGGLGIDLAGPAFYGVTPNDLGDADTGPNRLQNYPVITNASGSASGTIVSGTLNSTANSSFLIDVYRNIAADASGHGQGQFYLGSVATATSGDGNAAFSFTASSNFAGQYFSATATDLASGDTSEFSLDFLATNLPSPPFFLAPLTLTSTGFLVSVSVTIGQRYRLQASTNLAADPILWTDLTSFVAGATNLSLLDRSATNYRSRFYRVISP